MKEINLGARLQGVADYIPKDAKIADIGTDHAYLPIYLIQSGNIEEAVGIDVHEGPYQSALGTVQSYGLESRIQIRLGDGLFPLKEGEADTLILAGMGGNTMLEILEARPEILARINQIISQPQGAQGKLRKTLLAQGWLLEDEKMVVDEDRLYTIISFSRKEGKTLNGLQTFFEEFKIYLEEVILNNQNQQQEHDHKQGHEVVEVMAYASKSFWDLGPLLIETREPLLKPYILKLVKELDQRQEQMKRSLRPEVQIERIGLLNEKRFLEGLLQWLFQLD